MKMLALLKTGGNVFFVDAEVRPQDFNAALTFEMPDDSPAFTVSGTERRVTLPLLTPFKFPVLEAAWEILNRDNRPGGISVRSLSMGDVLILPVGDAPSGLEAWQVGAVGFERVGPAATEALLTKFRGLLDLAPAAERGGAQ